jgi:hypothetical protein
MSNFNLKNAKPTIIPVPPKVIIYGRNGIGKSRFAAAAPNPIFLDLDKNINEISCVSNTKGIEKEFPLNTFQNVVDFLNILINEEHNFKTVVIDSISPLNILIENQIKKERNIESIADLKFGLGYSLVYGLWDQFLTLLNQLWEKRKVIIILIGHDKIRESKELISEPFDQYQLNVPEKIMLSLTGWCSAILYAKDRASFLEKKGDFGAINKVFKSSDRVLYTDGGTIFLAKATYNLPKTIPFNQGDAAKAWNMFYTHVQEYYKNPNQEPDENKGEKQ